jgi:hypothetical protein
MTLPQIREQAIKYALARGIINDEADVNYDSLDTDICSVNAGLLAKVLAVNGRVPAQAKKIVRYQSDPAIQPNFSEYTIFQVHQAVNNQYSYAGSSSLQNNSVRIGNDISFIADPINLLFPKVIRAYVDSGILTVYTGNIKDISLSFIPTDIRTIPTYNIDIDEFPSTPEITLSIVETLVNGFTKYVIQKPATDTRSDSVDTEKSINTPK